MSSSSPAAQSASLGKRFVATLIDELPVSLIATGIGMAAGLRYFGHGDHRHFLLRTAILLAVAAVVLPAVAARYDGRTPGKLALRIRVRRDGGRRYTFAFGLLREVVLKFGIYSLLPLAPIGGFVAAALLAIEALTAAVSWERHAIHDLLAKTHVVPSGRDIETAPFTGVPSGSASLQGTSHQ